MNRHPLGVLFYLAVASAALAIAAAPGCGLREYQKGGASAGTGGAAVTAGSGGQPQSSSGGITGNATGGSVGFPSGTGGPAPGSGGAPESGGSGTSSGGATGSGGAAGSGGRTAGSGGATGTGGAPLSGVTININGNNVPKEKAIVFIHFGHSNMQGYAAKPSSLRGFFYDTQPGLWIYRGSNTFVAATEPTAPSVPTDKGAGPGMALLKTAAAAAPADYHFISIGRGEGSAPSTDFLKSNNLLYPTVMNRAKELKGKVTFGALFVMLGITERHLPAADQPGFPMRIQQIIADMRADLAEPNLPVLFCDYEMEAYGDFAPTGAIAMAVRPMISMLPGLITRLKVVPTNMLGMQDDHHFDFNGQKLWSERAIQIMKDEKWFLWNK